MNKNWDNEYRNQNELNYFGSDLNKFANKECSKKMTVINIDILQFKRSQDRIRIIESKHKNESMPGTQREILGILAKGLKFLNKWSNKYTFEVYIVSGNYPYNDVIVEDLINDEVIEYNNKKDIKKFMNFNEGGNNGKK